MTKQHSKVSLSILTKRRHASYPAECHSPKFRDIGSSAEKLHTVKIELHFFSISLYDLIAVYVWWCSLHAS